MKFDGDLAAIATVLDQTQLALDAGLYFPALITALTIPDICAAMSSENGRASGSKYRRWLETEADYQIAEARFVWGYRCSLLHQTSGYADGIEGRVAFVVPGNGLEIHRASSAASGQPVFFISIPSFVQEIQTAAESWSARLGSTALVQRNLARSIHIRPGGWAPVVGLPVVA